MWFLGKTMANVRSDAPHSLPGRALGWVVTALVSCVAPLSAQSRAAVQVSAQVMAVQPSAEGLLAAQAIARSEAPAPIRAGGRVPLATIRRTGQGSIRARPAPAPGLTTAAPATKPTSIVEIQFLRN